eukprot:TRINITY_DN7529_c0_g1_i1.p1 TRINITY_DN7529_c0_g1~~TRINITY_DN7529_c0_g1_i1.p1  ORF type:complete len:116 (-),score=28.12 TRINITY_DN7529_c0_g1_i1:147-467(-)
MTSNTTLCVICNDGKSTYFKVPTAEIPTKISRLNGTYHYADSVHISGRITLHKFFGIALDDVYLSGDEEEGNEVRNTEGIFRKYQVQPPFTMDCEDSIVICLSSDT